MRRTWIDSAKAYGITLVFYGHILEALNHFGIAAVYLQYKFIYAFHMPLFFMLSGYLSRNNSLSLRYRFTSRLIPVIFFNLIAFPILMFTHILSGTFASHLGYYAYFLLSFVRGYPGFNFMTWFLVCLFVVETIDFLLLQRIKTAKGLMLAAICLYLVGNILTWKPAFFTSAMGLKENFWFINQALVAYLFYCIGSLLKKSGFLETKKPLLFQLLTLVFFGLILLLFFNLNSIVNMSAQIYGNPLLFPLTAIAGALCTVLLAKLMPSNKIILFIGQNTLILLGMNGLFVHFINASFASWLVRFLSDSHLVVLEVCTLATLASMVSSIPCILLLNKLLPQLVGKPKSDGPILRSFV